MSPTPTAVCFQTDEMAIPVLYRLPQYGLRVPRDLGAIAARKALAAMEGPLSEPRFETVAPQLMLRDTTAIAA